MFGSNFMANFGIPDFGYQNADAQGGFLGPNAPAGQLSPNAAPQSSIAAPNPLGGGPLSPGGGQPQPPEPPQAPPAAGLGSPFGKPGV